MLLKTYKSLTANCLISLLVIGLMVAQTGCRSYHFGARTLYPQDVRTVYVPMIESDSYRRNLGERLTEAVIKEIESKTTYKVVHYANADTTLRIHLHDDRKRIITPSPTDEPRELELLLKATATWTRQNGTIISQTQPLALSDNVINLTAAAQDRPEVGDSIATTQQKAIQRLARQIVETMETPW